MSSFAPSFLVAVPQLLDPNFRMAVVLLLQQSDEGALGIVVNRESNLRLRELCRDHKITYAGDPDKRVRVGGPVQPEQGLVLFRNEPADSDARPITDGLFVSASTGTLSRLCGETDVPFHCYSGYAGWAPGQLEREIGEGSWILTPVDPSLVFDTPLDEIWERALRDNGIDPAAIVPSSSEEA